MDILDLLKGQLGSGIASQLGGILGEDSKKTESAIGGALPAILGGLMGQASSKEGADALHKQLGDHDGGIFDNLGSMLSGGGHTGLLNSGSGILNGLLGDKLGGVADIIGKLSGLGGSSSTSLLGMLAPLVMGFIGKSIKAKGMDAAGLQGLMMDQKEHVAKAMPAGMGDALGLSSSGLFDGLTDAAGNVVTGGAKAVTGAAGAVTDAGRAVTGAAAGAATDAGRAVTGAAGDAAQAGGSMIKTLLPLIILAALGYFGFKMLSGGGAADAIDKGKANLGAAADSVADGVSDAMPDMPSFDLKNPADGLKDMFGSATKSLEGVTDAESATNALPGLEDLFSKLQGASTGIAALPEAAQGPVKTAVGGFLPKLTEMVTKVTGIDGVDGILGTVLGKIVDLVKGMAG